jgi:N-succinyldiaminopimelate aminotransferase
MPRHPALSPAAGAIYKSVFARVAERLAAVPGEKFPLHIGDTYLDPLDAPAFESSTRENDRVTLARYAHPHGRGDLLAALRARAARDGLPHGADEVLVTAGATHALFVAAAAVTAPGDEVLVLAPHWPLIPGILRTAGAVPVEVPFFDRRAAEPDAPLEALLASHLSPRTTAIYFNTPNNPTGHVLCAADLAAIARFADAHGLWIFADEVYAGFELDAPVPLIATLAAARDRTLSAFSFSKAFAMAGYRVGWLVGPAAAIDAARKVSTHTVYSVSGLSQRLALSVLDDGASLEARAREAYRAGALVVMKELRARFARPQGGGYVFVDLRAHGDPAALLDRALDRGVALSPGGAFGASYAGWARLCYTAVPPDALSRGIALLNELLDAPLDREARRAP